jgi:hypothetical protein
VDEASPIHHHDLMVDEQRHPPAVNRLFTTKALKGCKHTVYNCPMIKSFKHKSLEAFFTTGKTKGIQADHG